MKKFLKGFALFISAVAGAYILSSQPQNIDTAPFIAKADDYSVRIIRDTLGVPHIYGTRDADVAFGLAYAHAQDDFTTIQDVMLATRGMLATLKGSDAAPADYLVRLMRVKTVSEYAYENQLSAQAKAIAQAYADGLNYYAAQNPDEVAGFALPFKGADITAGFTFKTPLFYGFQGDITRLFTGTSTAHLGLEAHNAFEITTEPQVELGSQGIAITSDRMDDGRTHLVVNSHQPLTGPVAWYEARLKSDEGLNIAGGTFPGVPLILHGSNANLGWANTVNKPDLVDIYKLTINPDNDHEYLLDGAWVAMEEDVAYIKVRLLGPIYWTFDEDMLFSEHGPVINNDNGTFAIRWAGMNEGRHLDQLLALNKAENFDGFMDALAINAMPSLSYVYGDKDGNVAHIYNGRYPERIEDIDWSGVIDGTKSALIWQNYLPFEASPKTINPPSGIVFNANNNPYVATVGAGSPLVQDFSPTMGLETRMTNRATRLHRLLDIDSEMTYAQIRAIKYDLKYDENYAPIKAIRAFTDAPLSAELANDPSMVTAFAVLKNWDLSTDVENRNAALGVLTLAPLNPPIPTGFEVFPRVEESFVEAVNYLNKYFGTLTPRFGDINRIKRGNANFAIDGGPDILRAVYGQHGSLEAADEYDGQFDDKAGDSYIHFASWDKAGNWRVDSINNFGSTTHESSTHYADQLPSFVGMTERKLSLDLSTLLLEATSDLTIP